MYLLLSYLTDKAFIAINPFNVFYVRLSVIVSTTFNNTRKLIARDLFLPDFHL